MDCVLRLLSNRDFVFGLALVLGLTAGGPAAWTRPAALPALGLVMTLSCLGITGRLYRSSRELLTAAVAGVLLSYLVLGGSTRWPAPASARIAISGTDSSCWLWRLRP